MASFLRSRHVALRAAVAAAAAFQFASGNTIAGAGSIHCDPPPAKAKEMQLKASTADNRGVGKFNASQVPSTFRVDVTAKEEPEVAGAERFEEELDNALDHHAKLSKTEAIRLAAIEAMPRIRAPLAMAPDVPPPIERRNPARLVVDLYTTERTMTVSPGVKYPFWTFNDGVPGPMIRARVGDVIELNYTNKAESGISHNIDLHSVVGPGGGGPCLYAEQDETKTGIFKVSPLRTSVRACVSAISIDPSRALVASLNR